MAIVTMVTDMVPLHLTVLEFVARDGSSPVAKQHDIATAHARWKDYKHRKPQEK